MLDVAGTGDFNLEEQCPMATVKPFSRHDGDDAALLFAMLLARTEASQQHSRKLLVRQQRLVRLQLLTQQCKDMFCENATP
jgi:hypothetical protein